MDGYLLGVLISTVITVIAVVFSMYYILGVAVNSAMSLGGSRRSSDLAHYLGPLLVIGGYLSIPIIIALFSSHFFNTDPITAFLLNISPAIVLISVVILFNICQYFIHRRRVVKHALKAIEDAPNIHLEAPFVKK